MPDFIGRYYAVRRSPGAEPCILICADGVDPASEAARGGTVIAMAEISAAEAAAIKAARPVPLLPAPVQADASIEDVLRLMQQLAVKVQQQSDEIASLNTIIDNARVIGAVEIVESNAA